MWRCCCGLARRKRAVVNTQPDSGRDVPELPARDNGILRERAEIPGEPAPCAVAGARSTCPGLCRDVLSQCTRSALDLLPRAPPCSQVQLLACHTRPAALCPGPSPRARTTRRRARGLRVTLPQAPLRQFRRLPAAGSMPAVALGNGHPARRVDPLQLLVILQARRSRQGPANRAREMIRLDLPSPAVPHACLRSRPAARRPRSLRSPAEATAPRRPPGETGRRTSTNLAREYEKST